MPRVLFQGHTYESAGLSVLDCLTTRGHAIPSACRSGACQSCLMRVLSGTPPPASQSGLPDTYVARNLFLACQCFPTADLEVDLAEEASRRFETRALECTPLGEAVMAIRLLAPDGYCYRAGQFLCLYRDEQTSRNYSLASVPGLDRALELHVRRVPGGEVSGWIFDRLQAGDRLMISEARGECFYAPGKPEQNMLLIGTGCGLAPLRAILRDALAGGHRGRICLYHGSRERSGLYLQEALRGLAAAHPNVRYHACVSGGEAAQGERAGTAMALAMADHPDLGGWRVFLCGNPKMVEAARIEAFLAGAGSSEIFADPFLPSGQRPAGIEVPLAHAQRA